MQIATNKLRQIILEEARLRVVEEMALEELFGLILEQDKELSDEEYLQQYKKDSSFRKKVNDFFVKFDELNPVKRRAAIIALGVLGAAGTEFAGDYAAKVQASNIASELRADLEAAEAEYFGTLEDLKSFRDAAVADGQAPIAPGDAEGIEQAKDKFINLGTKTAPIIGDQSLARATGTQEFVYTPADNIPDDTILPFVGMSKADWETIIRRWLTQPNGRADIERYLGTKGRGQAIFWAYGPENQLFTPHTYDEGATPPNLKGDVGMWLPPEWSVAYDVVQKNIARAGSQPSPEEDLGIPVSSTPDVWKESLRKYLHSIMSVL